MLKRVYVQKMQQKGVLKWGFISTTAKLWVNMNIMHGDSSIIIYGGRMAEWFRALDFIW